MILLTNNEGTLGVPTTARLLAEGAHALDAIEAGIRLIEADPSVRTVGRGGWPNLLGEMELDACMMDGTTLRSGAVGALQGYPASGQRRARDHAALPHEFLVGEGAAPFRARDRSGTRRQPDRGFTPRLAGVVRQRSAARTASAWPDTQLAALCRHAIDPEMTLPGNDPKGRDTTVFLAHDSAGNICSGTSTSGWGWKYPGRLGDSPIIGAGSYADTRYGAAACTGAGEMTIRCCTARSIVLYMKKGASVADAVGEAVEDMRALKGGLISRVTIHAIDTKGNHKVVAVNGAGDNRYWLWDAGEAAPNLLPAQPVVITSAEARAGGAAQDTQPGRR